MKILAPLIFGLLLSTGVKAQTQLDEWPHEHVSSVTCFCRCAADWLPTRLKVTPADIGSAETQVYSHELSYHSQALCENKCEASSGSRSAISYACY